MSPRPVRAPRPASRALPCSLLFLALASFAPAAEEPVQRFELSGPAGGFASLVLDGQRIELPPGGGFRVFDATADRAVPLGGGVVTPRNQGVEFNAQGDGVRLRATFSPQRDHIRVAGVIENTRGDDRGFKVDYLLPAPSTGGVFSGELDEAAKLAEAAEEGNVFPVATLSAGAQAVALAIPPDEPRVFGMVRERDGVAVRFYLGTSPATRRFPNAAPFVFLLYRADAKWGFRDALTRYYALFPDYYRPRLQKEGLMGFQLADRVPPNVAHYGWNLSESQWEPGVLRRAIQRDEANGIATIPYMIVGQREVKFLPELPRNYEQAMAVYEQWDISSHRKHPVTKENVASDGDIHLRQEVDASAIVATDGRFAIVVRDTPWGGKSVTFKTNPNPDLFADQGRPNVGSLALQLQERWFKEHPEYDGVFIDSMGANWPAVLNYRRDHFTYARYPLTFDPWGKVAIHNELSHYEYIETLRGAMRPRGKLLLANGIYAYNSRGTKDWKPGPGVEFQNLSGTFHEFQAGIAPPEHHRAGTRLGRFFDCALLDLASSEFGIKSTVQQCRDVRVFMGRKHYAFLNYAWEDGAKIEEFVNRSLAFGIYASTSTNFFTGVKYEDHPNGYLRDRALLDWYVPLVRMLSSAGWQPVTHATVQAKSMTCERFGRGDVTYLACHNDSDAAQSCEVRIDFAALGLPAGRVDVTEIARGAKLATRAGGVAFSADPRKTYILQLRAK